MNVHKNARTCPASRELLNRRVSSGVRVTVVADSLGLSERRAREWRRRGKVNEPMTDRSSRPNRTHPLSAEKRDKVIALRRQRLTYVQIAQLTQVSLTSVGRICRAQGLNRLSLVDALPVPPVVRYERERPGELLHLDIKKLGRFVSEGRRATGERSFASEGAGWECLHVAIDDRSRISFAEILPDEKGSTCAAFLERAVAWYASLGVTIERALTDNGPGYLSKEFAAACKEQSVTHKRTRPYRPQTNGKAERMIQTLLREWAYRFAYRTSTERRDWLVPYLHFYNVHRRHSALNYNPPVSRLDRNNLLANNS